MKRIKNSSACSKSIFPLYIIISMISIGKESPIPFFTPQAAITMYTL